MKKFLYAATLLLPLMAGAQELSLLTWNVFMIPKPINFTLQPQRTELIAEQLKNSPYDVIMMNEAFIKKFRTKVGRALRPNFPHQEFLQRSVRPWHFMNSGLFVLSRHPFEVLDHWYYTKCTHADCLSAKGVLLIEVTLPANKKVQIAMTHMQAWDDLKAQKVRAHQFQEIKDLLELHAVPGVPQILTGDLNIDGKATHEYPLLLNLMEMKARPLDSELNYTTGFKTNCYKIPGGASEQWLDHVWVNPRGSKARILNNSVRAFTGLLKGRDCPLSDHNSVEARIQL